MKLQEVILRAMSGELTWLQAADILRMRPRSLRRWRARYEREGYDGLLDRRTNTPSPRRAPAVEVRRVLQLYRSRYAGFNVRHFHQVAQREHGVTLSYSYVKKALQEAGLVKKRRARGKHRRRRERKPCFGQMLHLDGSPHAWLALKPEQRQVLIAVVDDATSRVLYARLEQAESTETVMKALRNVVSTHGIPMSLYTDRAGWAAHTPKAGGPVDKTKPTQVGRALEELGVEHILAYSPQARGRSERLNRTFQDRLVNELRAAGIRTVEAANRYIQERFLAQHNADFAIQPGDPHIAFVNIGTVDLELLFCHQEQRVVAKDNTVVLDRVRMQLDKQPGRRTCAGLKVLVRRHLDRSHSIWWGKRCVGRFDRLGRKLEKPKAA